MSGTKEEFFQQRVDQVRTSTPNCSVEVIEERVAMPRWNSQRSSPRRCLAFWDVNE